MSNHTCPSPASRNRDEDLTVLAVAVVKDRLSFSDRLTAHVAEGGDLLSYYVAAALGVQVQINWSAVTDEELPAIKAWQNYCCDLFDSVEDHVVKTLLGAS